MDGRPFFNSKLQSRLSDKVITRTCSSSPNELASSSRGFLISSIVESPADGVFRLSFFEKADCISYYKALKVVETDQEGAERVATLLKREINPRSFLTVLKAICILKQNRRVAQEALDDDPLRTGDGTVFPLAPYLPPLAPSCSSEPLPLRKSPSPFPAPPPPFPCSTICSPTSRSRNFLELPACPPPAAPSRRSLLEQRLAHIECVSVKIRGDGNCLFRAAAYGLFGNQEYHLYVRHCVVHHMSSIARSFFKSYFETKNAFKIYLRSMTKSGYWGDEMCVRAIADYFRSLVHIVTTERENWYIKYEPAEGRSWKNKHLFLSYISPVHYDAFKCR